MLSLNKYFKIIALPLVLQLFLHKNCISQNLITNGSFENYTGIDCDYGGFDNSNVAPLQHILNNWYTLNSSDYFSSVCTPINFSVAGVPENLFGESYAYNGNSYVGCILFQANVEMKEYIYQQLSAPLQAGHMYCLSYYVSRADGITHAIHSIGAHFSNTTPTLFNGYYSNKTPQIINQNGFVTDTIGWTQIQGCYTAIGGEQFITIGNFNSNTNTDTLFIGSTNPTYNADRYAYYYIDDITLIDQSTVGFNELGNENSFSVYPNPANDVLNIKVGTIKENTKIKIADVIGRTILITAFKSQLDISFLEKGIYFVTIQQEGKTLGTKKIIKQ
jgi:hypothetical protein